MSYLDAAMLCTSHNAIVAEINTANMHEEIKMYLNAKHSAGIDSFWLNLKYNNSNYFWISNENKLSNQVNLNDLNT